MGPDSAKKLVHIQILPYANRYFQIGKSLQKEDRVKILLLLVWNLDVFVLSLYEVPGWI